MNGVSCVFTVKTTSLFSSRQNPDIGHAPPALTTGTPCWQTTGSGGGMYLSTDSPVGRPSFELSDDQLATVVDLLCCGAAEARPLVTSGMLEVPITIQVRKAMLKLKKRLGLTNMQIGGEFELLDMSTNDPEVL